jgi:hypothetical protein
MRRVVAFLILILFAVTLTAAPTAAQSDPTPTDQDAIITLVAEMEDAVIHQDRDAYLSHVDTTDPVFFSEHRYWVYDWATGDPLDRFSMKVSGIRASGDAATATLTVTWAELPDTSYRRAEFPVHFVRSSAGDWRYAGELWVMFTTEHFRVYAFPIQQQTAERMVARLPDLYDQVTSSLGYTPEPDIEIKLYNSQDVLGATTALRLPPIQGWNEPGESLKLFVMPGEMPAPSVLAHELTHYAMFDMAGTTHGHYPWWLAEGVAEEVSSVYWDAGRGDAQLERVRQWAEEDTLADWDAMNDYETTPLELWRYVYPQGYAFARYVTETYGASTRNAWLHDMAGTMLIEEATQDTFGITFAELDQGFRAWLVS